VGLPPRRMEKLQSDIGFPHPGHGGCAQSDRGDRKIDLQDMAIADAAGVEGDPEPIPRAGRVRSRPSRNAPYRRRRRITGDGTGDALDHAETRPGRPRSSQPARTATSDVTCGFAGSSTPAAGSRAPPLPPTGGDRAARGWRLTHKRRKNRHGRKGNLGATVASWKRVQRNRRLHAARTGSSKRGNLGRRKVLTFTDARASSRWFSLVAPTIGAVMTRLGSANDKFDFPAAAGTRVAATTGTPLWPMPPRRAPALDGAPQHLVAGGEGARCSASTATAAIAAGCGPRRRPRTRSGAWYITWLLTRTWMSPGREAHLETQLLGKFGEEVERLPLAVADPRAPRLRAGRCAASI